MPEGDDDPLRRIEQLERSKVELLHKLAATLRGVGMTPRELDGLLGDVEWRCLHRPKGQIFGIPPHFRRDWMLSKREATGEEEEEGYDDGAGEESEDSDAAGPSGDGSTSESARAA